MKFRASIAFLLVAAVSACTSASDSPLAPNAGASFAKEGVKPPPPLGSEDTYIEIDAVVSPGFTTAGSSFSAMEQIGDRFFDGRAFGRYFANTQSNNAWIAFDSVFAATSPVSKNARLQYNQDQNKTNGNGILVDADGTILNLALVKILPGSFFGPCSEDDEGPVLCAEINFTYNNNPLLGGTIRVWSSEPFSD